MLEPPTADSVLNASSALVEAFARSSDDKWLGEATAAIAANFSTKKAPQTVLKALEVADKALKGGSPAAVKAIALSPVFIPRLEKIATSYGRKGQLTGLEARAYASGLLRKWSSDFGSFEVEAVRQVFVQAWARVALATGVSTFRPFLLSPVGTSTSRTLSASTPSNTSGDLPTSVSEVPPPTPVVDPALLSSQADRGELIVWPAGAPLALGSSARPASEFHGHSDSDLSSIHLETIKFDVDDALDAGPRSRRASLGGNSGEDESSFVVAALPRVASSGSGAQRRMSSASHKPAGASSSSKSLWSTAPPSTSSESFIDLAFNSPEDSGSAGGGVPAFLMPMVAKPNVVATPIHNPSRAAAITDASTDVSSSVGGGDVPFVAPSLSMGTVNEDTEADSSVWPSTYSDASGWNWDPASVGVDGGYSYGSPDGSGADPEGYSAYYSSQADASGGYASSYYDAAGASTAGGDSSWYWWRDHLQSVKSQVKGMGMELKHLRRVVLKHTSYAEQEIRAASSLFTRRMQALPASNKPPMSATPAPGPNQGIVVGKSGRAAAGGVASTRKIGYAGSTASSTAKSGGKGSSASANSTPKPALPDASKADFESPFQYYESELRRKDAVISFLMQQLEAARGGKPVALSLTEKT